MLFSNFLLMRQQWIPGYLPRPREQGVHENELAIMSVSRPDAVQILKVDQFAHSLPFSSSVVALAEAGLEGLELVDINVLYSSLLCTAWH